MSGCFLELVLSFSRVGSGDQTQAAGLEGGEPALVNWGCGEHAVTCHFPAYTPPAFSPLAFHRQTFH